MTRPSPPLFSRSAASDMRCIEIKNWKEFLEKIEDLKSFGAKFIPHDNLTRCEIGFKNDRCFIYHFPFGDELIAKDIPVNTEQELVAAIDKYKKLGPIYFGVFAKISAIGFVSYNQAYNGISERVYTRKVNLIEPKFNQDFVDAILREVNKTQTPLMDHIYLNTLDIDRRIVDLKQLLL